MKREVKIGIFAVVILCCSWAGIRFLSGIDIFGRNVDYYAQYDKINGINTASPILIQGVKVGKVIDILLDPQVSDKVTLKLSIKRRYQIPEGSVVTIYSPGLMSSMAVGLELGQGPEMLHEGDTIATRSEVNLMDVAAEKLMAISDQISIVGSELSTTLSSVNSILESNGGNINSTLTNLNAISSELSLLVDSQRSNMESVVEGFASLSTSLGDNSESIENIISNLDSLASELSSAQLGDGLSSTLEQLNITLAKLNSNEGSVGKLLSDEQLYENLAAVSGSLNELIVDMQTNPKRYVHFSLFGAKDKSVE
ncbi:MAG: MlaD family protein [Rikenellaceae bacterium]